MADRLWEFTKKAFEKLGKGAEYLTDEFWKSTVGMTTQEISDKINGKLPDVQSAGRNETFASSGGENIGESPAVKNSVGTFASPVETGASEKESSGYTRKTAARGSKGDFLTSGELENMDDADVIKRYKAFFGGDPKDAKTARMEFVDLIVDMTKPVNPLLD